MSMNELFSIEGKTALVTGGSRGIGLMIARGFVKAGARVTISSRKASVCDEVAAELSKLGTCHSLPADLSTEAEANRLAAAFSEREPRLHILVNNAGANWGAPLAEYPDSAWDKVLALNVKGVFHLTRALVPQLAAAASDDDPARVINIGSIDGLQVPLLETYAYSASKAAVHHLTRVLARKLAPQRITVNAVAPGPFESKMMAATLEQFGDSIAKTNPLGRIGRDDDMAGVAIYLASRAAAYVTGAVIPVDGGISTTKHSSRARACGSPRSRGRLRSATPRSTQGCEHPAIRSRPTISGSQRARWSTAPSSSRSIGTSATSRRSWWRCSSRRRRAGSEPQRAHDARPGRRVLSRHASRRADTREAARVAGCRNLSPERRVHGPRLRQGSSPALRLPAAGPDHPGDAGHHRDRPHPGSLSVRAGWSPKPSGASGAREILAPPALDFRAGDVSGWQGFLRGPPSSRSGKGAPCAAGIADPTSR
jgi:NAD(P)-dependent dehydrogenase (short-subunit alcohol dehydrogenase family)